MKRKKPIIILFIIEIIRLIRKNYEDAMSNAKKELEANLQKAINFITALIK